MNSSNPKDTALRLETIGVKYIENKTNIKNMEDENKTLSDIILECLDSLSTKSYSYSFENEDGKTEKITFTNAERSKVTYDNEKVKSIVGARMYSQIVDREIHADWNKLVLLAKKYGIAKDEILECLEITETVNSNKLKNMYDIGEIDLKKLKGTFTIDSKNYLMVKKS